MLTTVHTTIARTKKTGAIIANVDIAIFVNADDEFASVSTSVRYAIHNDQLWAIIGNKREFMLAENVRTYNDIKDYVRKVFPSAEHTFIDAYDVKPVSFVTLPDEETEE